MFNEDEAVWRAFDRRRSLRSLLGSVLSVPDEDLAAIYGVPTIATS